MANVYVYSGAAGAGTGADWTNAYTTLGAALTAKAAGDRFWVAHDHAESTAGAVTLTSPGTSAAPCYVYCVNRAGTVPPVSADLRTTATVTVTGTNSLIIRSALAEVYGIIFSAGTGASTGNLLVGNNGDEGIRLTNCALRLGNTGATSRIILASSAGSASVILDNTTLQFGATGQTLQCVGFVHWKNTASAFTGATFPTSLISFQAFNGCNFLLEGVDLSSFGSGKTLVDPTVQAGGATVVFKDCKLGASVAIASTPSGPGYPRADVIRSDSGATNYRHERYRYEGTQTVETTIVRTGGASDGTTPIAWKIITTANVNWPMPFEALPIAIWNDSTTSVTVTVYGIWGGGAVPNNDDIWMDVEYLGSALTPQGSFATSTKADNLATASALTTDTSTWGGSTTKFKMTATFTPAQKGAIYIYIKAAAASSTFYIDPKPVLS